MFQGGVHTRLSPEARIRLDLNFEGAQSHIAISSRHPSTHSGLHHEPYDFQLMILQLHSDCFQYTTEDIAFEQLQALPELLTDGYSVKFFEDGQLYSLKLKYESKKIVWHCLYDEPRFIDSAAAEAADFMVLWTWVLKITGIVESPHSLVPTESQRKSGAPDPWANFRSLYSKSKKQRWNNAEHQEFAKDLQSVPRTILESHATVVCCTPPQLGTDLMKDIKYDLGIVDEATVMTETELVQVWRVVDNLILVGDRAQLSTTILSRKEQNPFKEQLEFSPYNRFTEMGFPYHPLLQSMRMTAGLLSLANDLFYEGTLIDGPNTELRLRPMTMKWRDFVKATYSYVKKEPEGLTYPVFLSVKGSSAPEWQVVPQGSICTTCPQPSH